MGLSSYERVEKLKRCSDAKAPAHVREVPPSNHTIMHAFDYGSHVIVEPEDPRKKSRQSRNYKYLHDMI